MALTKSGSGYPFNPVVAVIKDTISNSIPGSTTEKLKTIEGALKRRYKQVQFDGLIYSKDRVIAYQYYIKEKGLILRGINFMIQGNKHYYTIEWMVYSGEKDQSQVFLYTIFESMFNIKVL